MTDSGKRHFVSYIWAPVIVALIIFYLSCIFNPDETPEVGFDFFIPIDKMVHFCMYFGLAGITSFNYILLNKGRIIILRLLFFAILIPVIYGGIIEILQANYFNRQGDWLDFLANTLGAVSTFPFSMWFRKKLLRKESLKEDLI